MRYISRWTPIFLFFVLGVSFAFGQENNSKPEIVGQTPLPLVTSEGTPITVKLTNLIVNDADATPVYPDGFTLEINSGEHYEVKGNVITPDNGFVGRLSARVRVNDGENNSDRFNLQIDVTGSQNVAPKITGQVPLRVNKGASLTVNLSHLQVTDPDNSYPNGFTLKLFPGKDYTLTGNTVTPSPNFSGVLKVPVTVNDGQNESNRFELRIEVIEVQNVAPKITGQSPLTMNEGSTLTIELSHLQVTDPDNNYPNGFTLKLFPGKDYALNGNTVTPSPNFSGDLKVPVTVNDGQKESNRFDLRIRVIKNQNVAPKITGQSPLSINEGASVTIELSHLQVTDPDNNYPNGFTLKLLPGKDYTLKGNTVTPSPNFSGDLKVPVTVNDGQNESNRFDLKIDVIKNKNVAPKITGQSPLSINEGASLTIELSHLQVTDPDNSYPSGFTLKLFPGKNYTLNGNTITPSPNFSGNLKVPVTVNDGQNESNRFDLKIDVIKNKNVAPKITGQSPLSINEGASLTIELSHLQVTDPDNNYPNGFTLKLFPDKNYILNGNTITPSPNFSGNLKVPVTVNDGQNESNHFDLKIDVIKNKNVAPKITGQSPLSINEGASLTIELSHLQVTDPDNNYPNGFTLKLFPDKNYTLNGNTITPSPNFSGNLKVPVTVNDGQNESNRYELKIEVVKNANVMPQITGQENLTTNEDEPITLQLSNLKVSDPDNAYPTGFTLKISEGQNYSVSGLLVNPNKNFSGKLSVPVSVNDGKNDSQLFLLQINVNPVNDIPVITGQLPLSTPQNTVLSIDLSKLIVADPDNKYPDGFSLRISKGNNYSFVGNIVTPSPEFVGILNVGVSVNDGTSYSPEYKLKIEVQASTVNTPPVITGQKRISIAQNTLLSIQFSHLIVYDADNDYPQGFSLKIFPGDNYSISGTTVTPVANFINGTLSVPVTVNDGRNESAPFQLKIQVVPVTSKPKINGQKEITVMEDSTIQLSLSDLIVVDADDPDYPKGFLLIVLQGHDNAYARNGNSITPVLNITGFIEVGVRVSDGLNISDEYKVSILVNPVNDAPEILNFDTTALAFQPGNDPLTLFEPLGLQDIDNNHLIFAEIGFREINHKPQNDELILKNDSSKIRTVYDTTGNLFLIGYATLEEYRDALQNIQYNYRLTEDEKGNPAEVSGGARSIYINVYDGQSSSLTYERKINMEVNVALDIANTFTPNGDYQNDTWRVNVLNRGDVGKAIIKVYDKRGVLLYEAKGFEKEWDGYFNGQVLPTDTYYYTIDLNLRYMKKTYKGAVMILH